MRRSVKTRAFRADVALAKRFLESALFGQSGLQGFPSYSAASSWLADHTDGPCSYRLAGNPNPQQWGREIGV